VIKSLRIRNSGTESKNKLRKDMVNLETNALTQINSCI